MAGYIVQVRDLDSGLIALVKAHTMTAARRHVAALHATFVDIETIIARAASYGPEARYFDNRRAAMCARLEREIA